MVDKIKLLFDKFTGRLPEEKKPLLIIAAGVILMLLVLFSGNGEDKVQTPENTDVDISYAEAIEIRLEDIISSINGAGKTKVMVTLDSSEENIYATDINDDKSEYVVIKTSSDEGGLLLKIIQPEIRGVAVVCEGGDLFSVKSEIINTICSVLDINSSAVSVSKMKNGDESDE